MILSACTACGARHFGHNTICSADGLEPASATTFARVPHLQRHNAIVLVMTAFSAGGFVRLRDSQSKTEGTRIVPNKYPVLQAKANSTILAQSKSFPKSRLGSSDTSPVIPERNPSRSVLAGAIGTGRIVRIVRSLCSHSFPHLTTVFSGVLNQLLPGLY